MRQEKTQIEYVSVDNLKAYERNARTHSDEQVQQVAESIKEFGFTNPVLIDENNELIAGHGRTMAAKSIGMKEAPEGAHSCAEESAAHCRQSVGTERRMG